MNYQHEPAVFMSVSTERLLFSHCNKYSNYFMIETCVA